MMNLELAGKRVLVTGGTKGVGLAVVRLFHAEGAQVLAVLKLSDKPMSAGARLRPMARAKAEG